MRFRFFFSSFTGHGICHVNRKFDLAKDLGAFSFWCFNLHRIDRRLILPRQRAGNFFTRFSFHFNNRFFFLWFLSFPLDRFFFCGLRLSSAFLALAPFFGLVEESMALRSIFSTTLGPSSSGLPLLLLLLLLRLQPAFSVATLAAAGFFYCCCNFGTVTGSNFFLALLQASLLS